jgi:glycosyltransferase involved in cell wall biosynthesis
VDKRPECFDYALKGLEKAERVLVGNQYFRTRVLETFIEKNSDIVNKIVEVPLGVDTGTFTPRTKDMHSEIVNTVLVQNAEQFTGRTAKQSMLIEQEFSRWMDQGEIPSKIFEYAEQYSQKNPDEDLPAHLLKIDWTLPTVMYVGRLILGKGVHDLLVSFCELAANRDVQMIVIGAGPLREWLEGFVWFRRQGQNSMIESWIDVASEYFNDAQMLRGLDSWYLNRESHWNKKDELKVVFTGFMDHTLLRYILPCADIAVFPSLIPESFGLVALEAAAAGVVPLVTDFSGLRDSAMMFEEQIPELKEGSLRFPLESVDRIQILTQRIEELLMHSKNKSIKEKIRMVCETLYSWKSVTKQLVQVYNSVT